MISLLKRTVLTSIVFSWWAVDDLLEDFVGATIDYGMSLKGIRYRLSIAFQVGLEEAQVAWRDDYYATLPYRKLPWWLEGLKQNKKPLGPYSDVAPEYRKLQR